MSERPVFNAIGVGDEVPPVTKVMTEERIYRWADVVDDHNPIHVDPGFARNTPFGGIIAHGPMSIAFICEMMTRWLGKGWVCGGSLQLNLIAPTRPGDTVTAKGTVLEKIVQGNSNYVVCAVHCENQRGEKTMVGKAKGIVGD